MANNYWYGIKPIRHISHGEWSDGEIQYRRHRINEHDIEDCMWERFKDAVSEGEIKVTDYNDELTKFETFMLDNSYDVKDMFNDFIRNGQAEYVYY